MGDFGSSRGLIHSLEADGTAVANSTVQTALATAKTIGAGSFMEGEVIRVTLDAIYGSTGTPNLTFIGRLGGLDIISSGALAAGGAGGRVEIVWEFTVRSTGALGTVLPKLKTTSNIAALNALAIGATPVTVNQTLDRDLDITVTISVADALNTITAFQFFVEFLKSK
ncbi:hypothetical protein LCGC14_0450850 [marine sediment metagenome]|uniref:Uncharacterized protein n=1 Tax=marine sediment metagenome TaxID=412755 RepID=A0A0F9SN63_9ZZZZ